MLRILIPLLVLGMAGCAQQPARESDLRGAVDRALAARELPPRVLGIVDNLLAHEAPPPPGAPALLDALFKDPLAAADASALWRRAVPRALEEFLQPAAARPEDFDVLLSAYLAQLEQARQMLGAATQPFDEARVARALQEGMPAELVPALVPKVDAPALERASTLFLQATARFSRALRAPGTRLPPPGERDSPLGRIIIGSPGRDRFPAAAALIIDPGGDDVYERAPVLADAVSVVIDLAGDDTYEGSDVALRGLAALVDLQGNDRYRLAGPGLAAAIAGASVLVDYQGDDVYEARFFAQGAAVLGLGALVDASGNDRYAVEAFGQGYAFTGGVAVLWDRAGNDAYAAGGIPDGWKRGALISFSQGAAAGARTPLGGGVGILRDDAGDDRYDAHMFAQGVGYYYALGLLWDRGGRDFYHAVRYAQGNGVHQAVGVLRDESGEDRYELTVGVGQGMGLDIAVGVLVDAQGDDVYAAGRLAQAAATANGVGLLIDRDGGNRLAITSNDVQGWGHAQWERRLPSVAALVDDGAQSFFERDGKPAAPAAPHVVHSAEDAPARCPKLPPAVGPVIGDFARLLYGVTPGLPSGKPDPKRYGEVLRRLLDDPAGAMRQVPGADFNLLYALGYTLQCALLAADDSEAARIWAAFDRMLGERTPFLGVIAHSLQRRPGPSATMAKLRAALHATGRCSAQAFAVQFAPEAEARAALGSSCWRLQAAAYARLQALGAAHGEDRARLPYLPQSAPH